MGFGDFGRGPKNGELSIDVYCLGSTSLEMIAKVSIVGDQGDRVSTPRTPVVIFAICVSAAQPYFFLRLRMKYLEVRLDLVAPSFEDPRCHHRIDPKRD
jgi:hypothetical protein